MFEWDAQKNIANIAKHGISFELAALIFDNVVLTKTDTRKNYGEYREISTGKIKSSVFITVVHTNKNGLKRIISARLASRKEREIYEKELQKTFKH